MDRWQAMRLFVKVAETESFAETARSMHMSAPAITRAIAVRIGHLPDSGFTATKVGVVRRVICGAQSYFEKHGVPLTPTDLKEHRIVASTSAWASPEWRFAGEQRVTMDVALQCNTNEAAIETARTGRALTRVPFYQIGPALVAGDLQIVLADHEEEPLPIHVMYPEGRHAPAKVRAFVDLAVARLRENRLLNYARQ